MFRPSSLIVVVFSAAETFQQVLYATPVFQRTNEVHLRLGLVHKALEDFDLALKVRSFCPIVAFYFTVVIFSTSIAP